MISQSNFTGPIVDMQGPHTKEIRKTNLVQFQLITASPSIDGWIQRDSSTLITLSINSPQYLVVGHQKQAE